MERNPPRHDPPVRLSRDIAVVLAAKFAALALLYAMFFGPAQRLAVDAGDMAVVIAAAPREAGAPR